MAERIQSDTARATGEIDRDPDGTRGQEDTMPEPGTSGQEDTIPEPGTSSQEDTSCHERGPRDLDARIEAALAMWPQLDPEVEGVVTRIHDAYRYIDTEARATLARVGLTKEEFKVLMCLQRQGPRSHGWLCRRCQVSTGAMTNRLDKLERAGLVTRSPDPHDRRGVILVLTDGGRAKLDACIDAGGARERQLLSGMTAAERRELNQLLRTLIASLQTEIGPAGD